MIYNLLIVFFVFFNLRDGKFKLKFIPERKVFTYFIKIKKKSIVFLSPSNFHVLFF